MKKEQPRWLKYRLLSTVFPRLRGSKRAIFRGVQNWNADVNSKIEPLLLIQKKFSKKKVGGKSRDYLKEEKSEKELKKGQNV